MNCGYRSPCHHRHHFPDHRRRQLDLFRGREVGDAVQRVVPGVEGQVEGAVVHREEDLAAQVFEGLHALLRRHVHGGPHGVVGAVFHQGDVEAAEALADLLEAREVARVAAVEDALVAALHHP